MSPTSPQAETPTASKLRLSITRDGIYRLDEAYLSSHGFSLTGADPSKIHLSARGVEIPYYLEGPVSGTFGLGNAILFYGQKLSITDRPYFNGGDFSDADVYWLSVETTAGTTMAEVATPPLGGYPQPASFTTTVHAETNSYFYLINHLRPNGDVWFWGPYLGTGPGGSSMSRNYTLQLPHPANSSVSVKASWPASTKGITPWRQPQRRHAFDRGQPCHLDGGRPRQ